MTTSVPLTGSSPINTFGVFTDGTTCTGVGTQNDKIRVLAALVSVPVYATIIGPGGYKPGCAAILGASAPSESHVSLASSDAGSVAQNPTGINDGQGNLIANGPVTLTTEQWDTVNGSSGGLTPGVAYFVGSGGALVTTPPSTTGTWQTYVGTADTAETLDVSIRAACGPHA